MHGKPDMIHLTNDNMVQIKWQFNAVWNTEYCQKNRYYVLQVEEKGLSGVTVMSVYAVTGHMQIVLNWRDSGEYASTKLIIGRL